MPQNALPEDKRKILVEMYHAGAKDQEIADAIGYHKVTVGKHRRDLGLRCKHKGGGGKFRTTFMQAMVAKVTEVSRYVENGVEVVVCSPGRAKNWLAWNNQRSELGIVE